MSIPFISSTSSLYWRGTGTDSNWPKQAQGPWGIVRCLVRSQATLADLHMPSFPSPEVF